MEDYEIVQLYWDRDERAIGESERKYGGLCRGVALRVLENVEDSEECVSDTWLRSWNVIPPQRPTLLGAFLARITRNGKEVPFGNMRPVGMKMRFIGGASRRDGDDAVYVAKYLGAVDSIVWRLGRDGRLGLDAVLLNRDNGGVRGGFDDGFMDTDIKDLGFTFDYPKEGVTGMQWLGRGPYRVWKNRQRGHNIDLWHKDYNETVTGRAVRGQLEYPEFKGYHGNVYWLKMESETAPFTLYSATDGLFVKVFNPDEVQGSFNKFFPEPPEGDISLLLDIQAIKSFKPIPQQGPHSQPGNIRIKSGDEGLRIKVWFDFD